MIYNKEIIVACCKNGTALTKTVWGGVWKQSFNVKPVAKYKTRVCSVFHVVQATSESFVYMRAT
jgi:hypothetical protein